MAYTPEELVNMVRELIIDNTTNQVTPRKVRVVLEATIESLDQTNAASVTAFAPLFYDPFTNVFSIQKSDATHDGYLSKEDYVTFSAGGGGGSQDLQSVLTVGNTAIDKQIRIESADGLLYGYFGNTEIGIGDSTNNALLTPNSMFISDLDQQITVFKNRVIAINSANNKSIVFNIDPIDITENFTFNLPLYKNPAEYTLATIEDINIQQIIDSTASASKDFSNVQILGGSGAGISSYSSIGNGLTGTDQFNTEVAQYATECSMGSYSASGANQASVKVGVSIGFDVKKGSNRTLVGFEEPIYSDGAQTVFRSLPYTRTYQISVAQVFADATTIALSNAALNSAYPEAITGDKVNCLSIIAGALQYEKTDIGWISHIVTVVV